MTCADVRKERCRHPLVAASRERQPLLSADAAMERATAATESVRKVRARVRVALEPRRAGFWVGVAGISPRPQLPRHQLLDRLPIAQVRCAARTGSKEVVLAERQARREIGRLDQSAHARRGARRQTQPVPPSLDHLSERADCDSLTSSGSGASWRSSAPSADGGRRRPRRIEIGTRSACVTGVFVSRRPFTSRNTPSG